MTRACFLAALLLAAFGPAPWARSQERNPPPELEILKPRVETVIARLRNTQGTVECRGSLILQWTGPAAPSLQEWVTLELEDWRIETFTCKNVVPGTPGDPSEPRVVHFTPVVWGDHDGDGEEDVWGDLTGNGVPELRGDANLDGDVTLMDLIEVNNIIFGWSDRHDWTPPE